MGDAWGSGEQGQGGASSREGLCRSISLPARAEQAVQAGRVGSGRCSRLVVVGGKVAAECVVAAPEVRRGRALPPGGLTLALKPHLHQKQ